MSLKGDLGTISFMALGGSAGARELRGAGLLCVSMGSLGPYHRQSHLVRRREGGLSNSQITWPTLTLTQLFRGTWIRTSAFLAVKWGCSLSPGAEKGCQSERHKTWPWGEVGAVGQLCSPVLGEAGIECISLEAGGLEWNSEQNHQARAQSSTGVGGRAICPSVGASFPRAPKCCLSPVALWS